MHPHFNSCQHENMVGTKTWEIFKNKHKIQNVTRRPGLREKSILAFFQR